MVTIAATCVVGAVMLLGAKMCLQRYQIETNDYNYKILNGIPTNSFVCTETHKKLYDTMKSIDSLFSTERVDYFLIAGSALGLERHHGIIPWDDDIDIGVFDIEKARHVLSTKGRYKITEEWWNGIKVNGVVDIFHMEKTVNKGICYKNYRARIVWPNEWFKYEEIELERRPFGPIEIWASKKNRDYAERSYGKDALVQCEIRPPHLYSKFDAFIFHLNPLIVRRFKMPSTIDTQ